jgi:hypothetical protein
MAELSNTTIIAGYDVTIHVDDLVVGGAQSIQVTVSKEQKVVYEIGKKGVPQAIVDGQISVSGSIERYWFDMDLIKRYYNPESNRWPSFTLKVNYVEGVDGYQIKPFRVEGVKFKNLPIQFNVSEPQTQTLEFDALKLVFEE